MFHFAFDGKNIMEYNNLTGCILPKGKERKK